MADSELPEGTVTVLFTDLVDSTLLNQRLGDEGARDVGRQVDELARRLVDDNRGVLIKEMGDGLMAAFASARRAIAASRAIQLELARLRREGLGDVAMRIGLHTGEVLTEDGDLHGETVIIAKRIEGLAPPGGILASETTYGVLGTARDELVEQGPAELKGIDHQWTLYLVPVPDDRNTTTLADTEPTPYVGRLAERARLREMVEAAAKGQGGMALIGGPAGLGKSRLTKETAALGTQLGMHVLTGHCLDMESPPPYQPTIDHLEQAARDVSPEAFRSALGENAPEVAKLLPSLRQRYDDIPPSPELSPDQERRYMLHGVGQFIERAARARPILLVFEDLHWADESTLLFLRHLGGRISELPVLVIGTYRSDEVEADRPIAAALGPLTRDVGAVDLRPDLLTPDEVEAVLAARAGSPVPGELVDLVVAETQGNPFFVEELFRHLRDAGRLYDDSGEWRSGFEIGDTEVPHGVRLVIQRRLEQLEPAHRKALAAAAVVGRVFDFDLLAACTEADDDMLFDAIEAAERTHVIEEAGGDRAARYAFIHEQVRQTLLGELSLPRRQRVHLRIAEHLESAGGQPVEVAHHSYSAGPAAPAERTVAALIAAASANIEALAFEDAIRHLENAEPLVNQESRLEHRLMTVRALRGAGRVDDALDVLEAELQQADDPDVQLDLRLRRLRLLNDQYRAAEGLADIEQLLAATVDRPELAVDAQLARGRAHYILSLDSPEHAAESRAAYEAAYAAARQAGDKANMARALIPTSWFSDYWSDYLPIAAANAVEAVELAEEVGEEDLLLDAITARLRQQSGGPAQWVADAELLLQRLEARRDPVRLNAHCFWMMWQYLALGQFADSVAMCDRGMVLSELIGSDPVQYGSIKAIALTEAGRFDEVDAAIAQEVTDDGHPFGQAMASFARSAFLHRIEAWEPAAESVADTMRRAIDLNRVWMQSLAASLAIGVSARLEQRVPDDLVERAALPSVFGNAPTHVALADAAIVMGDPKGALSHLARTQDAPLLDRDRVLASEASARAHLALDNWVEARASAESGLAIAERRSHGSMTWRLRTLLAQALSAAGERDSAAATHGQARAEFEDLAARVADPDLRGWFERQPLAIMEGGH